MTVRIGQIELNGVQNVHTEESRTLVEQHVPRQDGSIFQDLGRDPLTVFVDGLLFGAAALSGLERLRAARSAAEPLPFAADVLIGSELTEVLIEDLQVRQVAGYPDRYRYTLRLREYRRLPGPAERLQRWIDADVAADAESWAGSSLAAASVLLDPASLPTALLHQPQLLEHLSGTDLGKSILLQAERLTGSDFGGVLQAVGKFDLAKAQDLVEVLRDADGLSGLLQKCVDEGSDFLSELTGIDLKQVAPLLGALRDGFEFLKTLKEVAESAGKLFQHLADFDPLKPLRSLSEG
ncbi:MAG: hypothetical protein AW09_003834 [Candidatus Accumulibacter phosphatis]|uniref:DNA circulation N-terminal domain-containing protein n=1 Tax=Candidatus Accumulibacter phosphatis TaxID=327160 RepID=A0A080LS01_9PROT|nr:hypothetical protein [Accumulibacter sp.]KFB71053.1 MAG: hypothetical protein AW09_003834 [Candidatus Accumulibacter phosphatis]MBL8408098.1 hypothetical protein [Accumulibacter sp.]HRF10618.1 hypothetical protein [Candidatus Accumulibacter phosphatis]